MIFFHIWTYFRFRSCSIKIIFINWTTLDYFKIWGQPTTEPLTTHGGVSLYFYLENNTPPFVSSEVNKLCPVILESNISLSWFKAFMSTKKTDNWANLDLKKKKFWLERRNWRHLKMLRLTTVHCQILSLPKIVTPYHRSSPHVAKVNQYLSYLHSFLHFDAYLSTLFRTSILFSASSNLSNQSVHTKKLSISYSTTVVSERYKVEKTMMRLERHPDDLQ